MENLLRGLLELPSQPAVILVQALEFNSARMANGGDVHLPVAVYYGEFIAQCVLAFDADSEVSSTRRACHKVGGRQVIHALCMLFAKSRPLLRLTSSMRNPLAGHFMRNTELLHPYFTTDWWQNPDVRHINSRGHRDMSNMVTALLQDVVCDYTRLQGATEESLDGHVETDMVMMELLKDVYELQDPTCVPVSEIKDASDLSDYWLDQAKQARPWGPWHRHKDDDQPANIQPGVWSEEKELGQVPRVRSVCASTIGRVDTNHQSNSLSSFDSYNIGARIPKIYLLNRSASAHEVWNIL